MRLVLAAAMLAAFVAAAGAQPTGRPSLSDIDIAYAAYDDENFEQAFDLFMVLASAGNSEAQIILASMYAFGQGVETDDAQAIAWLERSVALGNPNAQILLCQRYRDGKGVATDLERALTLCRAAADQGNARAIAQLPELDALAAKNADK